MKSTLACFLFISTLLPLHLEAAEFDPQSPLDRAIIGSQLASQEAQAFCEQRVLPLPNFSNVADWEKYAAETRRRVFENVVFRGEAANWRDAKTKVEWQETIDGGEGYRIKKVRFEALPGLWVPALLYEPTKLDGPTPVFLNVNGHDSAGKAATYKQTRCINQAKRGILSLNLEWFGMGQLKTDGFSHVKLNQLDLCGTSGVAPFYLAMSRAIDLLLSHPNADPKRVGVAGLSGGGWQTIFISSLDTRVTLCNPVAGYSSFVTRAKFHSDLGDSEQTPVDLGANADYATLTALLAPRPALLTFNATDNCCFAAGHALPPLLDAARPVYRLFGKENDLRWHVNHVPGNHNFGQENRDALYRVTADAFFPGDAKHPRHEIPCEAELKKSDALKVQLPDDNLDLHRLALRLAEKLPRPGTATAARLQAIVRAPKYSAVASEEQKASVEGIEVTHRRLRISDLWTVPAVEFTPKNPTSTVIVIADAGRKTTAAEVKRLLGEQKRVIAADLFYWGESKMASHNWLWALMVSTVGDRPLGVQAAQLNAISAWAKSTGAKTVDVVAVGPKTSLVTLVAANLEGSPLNTVTTIGGLNSLKEILEQDLTASAHAEYFCFALLEHFDIATLRQMLGADRVVDKSL